MVLSDRNGVSIRLDEGDYNKYRNKNIIFIDNTVKILDSKLNRYIPLVCKMLNEKSNHYHKFSFLDGDPTNLSRENVSFRRYYSPNQKKQNEREYAGIIECDYGFEVRIAWLGKTLFFYEKDLEGAVGLRNAVYDYIGKDKRPGEGRTVPLTDEHKDYIQNYLKNNS